MTKNLYQELHVVSNKSLRKQPFFLAPRAWDVLQGGDVRGETSAFLG